MKSFTVVCAALLSISASAGSYDCTMAVSKDGEKIGTMRIEQEQLGATVSNELYKMPISKRRNAFGKTVEEVSIVISGIIQSGGSDPSHCFIQALIHEDTKTFRRKIRTQTRDIATLYAAGQGEYSFQESGHGYSISGTCVFKP